MTDRTLIFWPMGTLALLTFAVLFVIPFRRFGPARAGKVTAVLPFGGDITGVEFGAGGATIRFDAIARVARTIT